MAEGTADPHEPASRAETIRTRPVKLQLDKREGLFIEWGDGFRSHYPLEELRRQCPCAGCRKEREDREPRRAQPSPLSLTVLPANIDRAAEFTTARLVGHYAIQITWADGHKTGIYDFRYLRMLSRESAG